MSATLLTALPRLSGSSQLCALDAAIAAGEGAMAVKHGPSLRAWRALAVTLALPAVLLLTDLAIRR